MCDNSPMFIKVFAEFTVLPNHLFSPFTVVCSPFYTLLLNFQIVFLFFFFCFNTIHVWTFFRANLMHKNILERDFVVFDKDERNFNLKTAVCL